MKIFSGSQIKAWDAFTIQHEPVFSIDLMERAALACFHWIQKRFSIPTSFQVFCGKGNNGGDGLAIARMLIRKGYQVEVFVVEGSSIGSPDFEINLNRLKKLLPEIVILREKEDFPLINDAIIIDALFGTGLRKKPSGLYLKLIQHLNASCAKVISIDVPSGLYIDKSTLNDDSLSADLFFEETENTHNPVSDAAKAIIKANYTLTFQHQKLAFLMPENEPFSGEVYLLDIQLSKEFEFKNHSQLEFVDKNIIQKIYAPRKSFANKGSYGYAAIVAGSYGMMGAAVLSSKACLRIGAGKLTTYTCKAGYEIMQYSVPEAMCKTSGKKHIKKLEKLNSYNAVGIGPGMGIRPSHINLLQELFSNYKKPLVLDADALNLLSKHPFLLSAIPSNSIITPHPKEFERLFGKTSSDFDKIKLALSKAKEMNIYIVLKGHYTFIASPDEKGYFNSTGNPGMATAGSGDVLTGIITGLLAQHYSPLQSCVLGVYIHGLAGDIAAGIFSRESMVAGDIIHCLGKGFKEIELY